MEIKLDPNDNQIKIDDSLKFQYWMIKFVMLSNLFQMTVGLLKPYSEWDTLTWFWIPIGLFSLFMLYYFTRLSTAEVITLEDIQHLIHKDFFGRKRLSLKLKNGKTRQIPTKSLKEMAQIEDFINSLQKI